MRACPVMLHAHPDAFGLVRLEQARIEPVPAGGSVAQWFAVPGLVVGDFVALSYVPDAPQYQGLIAGVPTVFAPGQVYVALHNTTATPTPVQWVTILVFWMRPRQAAARVTA